MNAWLPQASYPCGNFSDTSSVNIRLTKGSLGHAFTACIHTENTSLISICPYALGEITCITELARQISLKPNNFNKAPDTDLPRVGKRKFI